MIDKSILYRKYYNNFRQKITWAKGQVYQIEGINHPSKDQLFDLFCNKMERIERIKKQ